MTDLMIQANGKWPSILLSLGFDERVVSGKHGPCPMCEGKDRFRMIDLEGKCQWICNQCGSGDAINLIESAMNMNFKEIAAKVRPMIPGAEYSVAPKKPDSAAIKRLIGRLMDTWRAAKNTDELSRYLEARGLPRKAFNRADLRVGEIDHYDEDGKKTGKCNAMLARVITPQNKTVALHRTYFLPEGRKKKITKASSTINGGAIRLFNARDAETMIVAEGIETALAARYIYAQRTGNEYPAWATISSNGMKKLAVPSSIKHVIIMADNDASFTGQAAAYDLANRLKVREKRTVEVFMPKKLDTDWLDFLNEHKPQGN
jgi:putative DNA primase/helicase